MSETGIPRQGRHSFSEEPGRGAQRDAEQARWAVDAPSWGAAAASWVNEERSSSSGSPSWAADRWSAAASAYDHSVVGAPVGADRRAASRYADLPDWSLGTPSIPDVPAQEGRWSGSGARARQRPGPEEGQQHPSLPIPLPGESGPTSREGAGRSRTGASAVPPMPPGAWSRLQPRSSRRPDDDATAASGAVARRYDHAEERDEQDEPTLAHDLHAADFEVRRFAAGHSEERDEPTLAHDLHPGDFEVRRFAEDHSGSQDEPPHGDGFPSGARPRDSRLREDTGDWEDRTGGLEVIGAHVDEQRRRRGGWRRRGRNEQDDAVGHDEVHGEQHDADYSDADYSHADDYGDDHPDGHHPDGHDGPGDDQILVAPYDSRPQRGRRRRRGIAVLVSLLVLGGLVLGVVFGGQKLLGMFSSRDYAGAGTGTVQIRVNEGDSLSAIGKTLVAQGVIADVRPFVKAAQANPKATSITPGLYSLHQQMSGQAALDLLLNPSSRLISRVPLPEGLTAKQSLQRIADATGVPLAQLQAAAGAPSTLGLPPYANGNIEGFLFPATYEFQPGTSATDMLRTMVARTVQVLDKLQVPTERRLAVVIQASIVQAESGSIADMPKVARVLDNRLQKGQPLQLDTTVNYATGKRGLTTTDQDRANPSPYNTYVHPGLPPGAISNPGEEALRAVLAPAPGNWLYFVVVNPDTGETRFAATLDEHQKNVLIFQQWLRAHPGA